MVKIDYIVGDSIAAGINNAMIPQGFKARSGKNAVPPSKDDKGISQVGAPAKKVFEFLVEIGKEKFNNKYVILSTGLSNSQSDYDTIKAQLKFLLDANVAKVFVVGVSNKPGEKFPKLEGANKKILEILKIINNASGKVPPSLWFLGEFVPSADSIHLILIIINTILNHI